MRSLAAFCARISAQIAASARRSAPATKISSAWARNSSGIARVHLASCSATDLLITYPLGQGSQQHSVIPGQRLYGFVLAGLAPGHPGHAWP
jgi:hypothetical protein